MYFRLVCIKEIVLKKSCMTFINCLHDLFFYLFFNSDIEPIKLSTSEKSL